MVLYIETAGESCADHFMKCGIEHALGGKPATAEKENWFNTLPSSNKDFAPLCTIFIKPLEDCIRSSCSPHYSGRSYSCRKQKNTYITINQQCNYQIKNYSVYWLSIEGLNKFLYIINGGQFARIITFIEDRKGFLLFQNAP